MRTIARVAALLVLSATLCGCAVYGEYPDSYYGYYGYDYPSYYAYPTYDVNVYGGHRDFDRDWSGHWGWRGRHHDRD